MLGYNSMSQLRFLWSEGELAMCQENSAREWRILDGRDKLVDDRLRW